MYRFQFNLTPKSWEKLKDAFKSMHEPCDHEINETYLFLLESMNFVGGVESPPAIKILLKNRVSFSIENVVIGGLELGKLRKDSKKNL